MAPEFQKNAMYVSNELENGDVQKNFDDDGREKRTGNVLISHLNYVLIMMFIYYELAECWL